ncbi:type II toxin-antitoxin system ribonuclease VapC29 [soil metagenome]
MITLLDANVLIALTTPQHVHHTPVRTWFGQGQPFATCPITQGALIRFIVREGGAAAGAAAVVNGLARRPDHTFWADAISFDDAMLRGVIGHRQVTDAYLAGLARHVGGRLATLDGGLAAAHPDVVDLLR